MKLHYWATAPNFGDRLNLWLWEKVLPGFLDEDAQTLFFGIGTLLNGEAPEARRAVIFGTGVGYGSSISKLPPNWQVYCVRGPLSAMALHLSFSQVATDPAVLVRRVFKSTSSRRHRLAFIPHWKSASAERKAKCRALGIQYIDPLSSVEDVLDQVSRTELLLAEALHGAIVADALRTPWIAIHDSRNDDTLLFKWQDWCLSVALDHRPHFLAPERDFGDELLQIARMHEPRLSLDTRLAQALERTEQALELLKSDSQSGKFRAESLDASSQPA